MDHFVEYFLDNAVESMELDTGTATALRLYGSDREMLDITCVRGNDAYASLPWRLKLQDRRSRCEKLARYADNLLLNVSDTRRSGIIFEGLLWMSWGITELAEVLASWAIGDEVEGGYCKDFRKKPRMRKGKIFPNLVRKLESPEHIRKCVRNYENEWSQLRDAASIVVARMDKWLPQRDESIQREVRELMTQCNPEISTNLLPLPPSANEFLRRTSREDAKINQKIIKKSLKVALSIVGEEGTKAFLRGEEIKLVGDNAMVLVRKRRGLANKGEGCLSVAIAERNGTRLADLCTYIPNTPTLDQLAGLALAVMAGHEREILDKHANVIRITEAGIGHPMLQGRKARAETLLGNTQLFDIQQQQARAKAYFNKTRKIWIDALTLHVVPRRYVKMIGAITSQQALSYQREAA
jgi:hypothetical protein